MQGIYKITNLITNLCYIGKSNNIDRRWKDHKRLAFTEGHKEYNKALYCSMRKYGLDNFSFEIIEELEDYSLSDEKEKYWIKYYNSYFNGYNESLGGDGGSVEGHCQGSLNGRALLNEEDVIKIRTLYSNGISKSKCYKLFEDKISLGGFTNVWNGRNWKHIMPEVYTKENKERNSKIGKGISGKKRRNFSKEQVLEIRERRDNGESGTEVYKDFVQVGSKSSFDDIWYNRKYLDMED